MKFINITFSFIRKIIFQVYFLYVIILTFMQLEKIDCRLGIRNEENKTIKSHNEMKGNFMNNATISNATYSIDDIDYYSFFTHVGDKSFFCIVLLYFQATPLILLVTSFITKIILSYFNIFVSLFKMSDLVPIEVFQMIGVIVYYLLAFSIIYNLMFFEGKLLTNIKTKKKQYNSEIVSIINNLKRMNMNDFDAMAKIVGLILISQLIHVGGNSNTKLILSNNWMTFAFDTLGILISLLFALLIGYCLSRLFTCNCNLLFSSISFLLLGTDISVKFFSNKVGGQFSS